MNSLLLFLSASDGNKAFAGLLVLGVGFFSLFALDMILNTVKRKPYDVLDDDDE